MDEEDHIREAILRFLFEVHTERNGTDRGRTTGDSIVQEIRKRTGANRREISRNIDYLQGAGFIGFSTTDIATGARGGAPPTTMQRHLYQITVPGIARFEKASKFKP